MGSSAMDLDSGPVEELSVDILPSANRVKYPKP